ncbi:MAG: TlpA disulfide reductase family protein [Candidatus Aceula meridiana]|nr:TlpA disulfide reductase family protein [Candidatus Aceula meridiana]
MKIFSRVVMLVILGLLVFGLSKSGAQFFLFGNSLEGEPAPEFSLPTLTRSDVSLTEYRDDKPAILFFWATWCPHCRTALKGLDREYLNIESNGIKLVVVDLGESKKQVVSYVKRAGISLEIFLDERNSVADEYQVVGVPTFVLVDKEGIVISVGHSLPKGYAEALID